MFLPDNIVIYDVETTDLNLGWPPEIIEIGAVKVSKDFDEIETYTRLVRPSKMENFSSYIVSLTGIKTEDIEKAAPFSTVMEEWRVFCNWRGSRLCSWSSFDEFVLQAEYRRAGTEWPHPETSIDIRSGLWMMSLEWGFKLKGWSLNAACERFGIERPKKHRALDDATALFGVFKELVNLIDKECMDV